MRFEDVKFEHLGAGGLKGDLSLLEQIEIAMSSIAAMALEHDRDGAGKITIAIGVAKTGETSVVFEGSLKLTEPRRKKAGLAAVYTPDGRFVTQQHKQEPLPMNVSTMKPKKARQGDEKQ